MMTFEEWSQYQPGGGSLADYEAWTGTGGGGTNTLNLGGSPSDPTGGMMGQSPQLPPGIPQYKGYQAPNYGSTTPNSTHWLNTMNAFAPTARNDMSKLLGQGASGGAMGGSTGGATGGYPTNTLSPDQLLKPSQYPFQGQAPGLMDAFYNTPYSAYQQPTQPGQQYSYASTGLLGSPTQPTYQQPTQTSKPTGYSSTGTVGIDPATGGLTFL